jgi:hypothetical protein
VSARRADVWRILEDRSRRAGLNRGPADYEGGNGCGETVEVRPLLLNGDPIPFQLTVTLSFHLSTTE